MTEIRIHPKIFEDYPSLRRGIVIARNIQNQGDSPELEDGHKTRIAEDT